MVIDGRRGVDPGLGHDADNKVVPGREPATPSPRSPTPPRRGCGSWSPLPGLSPTGPSFPSPAGSSRCSPSSCCPTARPSAWLQVSTAAILVPAANTSFADSPRLMSFQAHGRYMPTGLGRKGRRPVFGDGLVILAAVATALVLITGAQLDRLIPRYAIGVFLSFTMSQLGMTRHHLRRREPRWRRGILGRSGWSHRRGRRRGDARNPVGGRRGRARSPRRVPRVR